MPVGRDWLHPVKLSVAALPVGGAAKAQKELDHATSRTQRRIVSGRRVVEAVPGRARRRRPRHLPAREERFEAQRVRRCSSEVSLLIETVVARDGLPIADTSYQRFFARMAGLGPGIEARRQRALEAHALDGRAVRTLDHDDPTDAVGPRLRAVGDQGRCKQRSDDHEYSQDSDSEFHLNFFGRRRSLDGFARLRKNPGRAGRLQPARGARHLKE